MNTIVEELSRSAPAIYPHIIKLFESTGVSLAGFTLLSSLRHANEQHVMRYSEVHKILEALMDYDGPDVTRLMKQLEKQRLAKRDNLGEEAFTRLFGEPEPHERRVAIRLLAPGSQKLDEFNEALEALLRNLLGDKLDYLEGMVRIIRHMTRLARPLVK